MLKDETYYFHQTPEKLVIELLKELPLEDGDLVLEPFKGEGAFYNNFPSNIQKDWCEIQEGRDFRKYDKQVDWVITNPPFKITNDAGKDMNSFFYLLNHFASKVSKGIAFLGNDYCLTSLTPKKLKEINEKYNLFIHKIVVCSIKKWRGRYFFIIFKKGKNDFYKYVEGNF